MNNLFLIFQKIKKNRAIFTFLVFIGILLALQATNILLINMLGLSDTALPWTFIEVLRYGFYLPVFIAFSVIFLLIAAGILWCVGGEKCVIAYYILSAWVLIILCTWIGIYSFSVWDKLNIPSYPWHIYLLFSQIPFGSKAYHHLIICLTLSYLMMLILLFMKLLSMKSKAEKIFGDAHFSNALEIKKSGFFSHQGVVLGKAYGKILRAPGFESVLVVAPTGSGKTTAIAIPNLLEWQGSGVFNDLKGELYKLTAEFRKNRLNNEVFLWAPADTTKQFDGYNPFFYVDPNPDLRIRDLQLIAETLIPASKLGDGFWYQSSREVFLTLSLFLFETKGMATLAEIHDLSKQEDFIGWLDDEVSKNEEQFSKYLTQNAYALLGADQKTQKNILKDFHSRMGLFNDPIVGYSTSKNDFDFRELRRKKISIYIHIPDSDRERLSPILTLFWAQLINTMSSREPSSNEPYGVLALMDEFGNMAKINKLKDGMSFLRSYHVRCIVIVQYLAQIYSTYGREDAKGFLNSKVKIAFALNDMDDAQFFSKALGAKTVKVSSGSVSSGHGNHSGSRSTNFNYQSRPLMHPDELMRLPNKKSIILIEARSPIKADKCYWFKSKYYRYYLDSVIITFEKKVS